MKVIKDGKYPNENKIKCEECQCEFQYYNTEIITETSTPLEQETFCGFGIHKYLKCPQCKAICTISYNFYEDKSIFTEIKEWFDKLIKKRCNNAK